jgi:hypothetical protein
MVEDETLRASGSNNEKIEDSDHSISNQKLVTSDGTYATQSAFSAVM